MECDVSGSVASDLLLSSTRLDSMFSPTGLVVCLWFAEGERKCVIRVDGGLVVCEGGKVDLF
jgi:hypothetical protein